MAGTTESTDETLTSTDDQANTKHKNTRSKTNKTTETQNTQAGDEKASDQGDLLNPQDQDNGDAKAENSTPDEVKISEKVNNETESKVNEMDKDEVDKKPQETSSSKNTQLIDGPLAETKGDNVDLLVINVTNNSFTTVLEPLSRVALESGKTTSITCHNQTFKYQVLENLRQLKGLGKNLTVE
ncbi:hypothetical protein IIQ44_03800 [Acinetobacter oleivorans]|uniref:Uncharacterized protein n=1 Tax=Acinetobacter oleivorans (strain JCM 16667 / KCTC 23045 / DR1) TaxID=436717 RepID=A0AAN0P7U1_ACISD|nr:hypothetical protein [Acinetobacter oleivorans]ADI90455.1 hypothetical protein AOLE_07820 [Acinetobacter oleivorans DR1]ESK45213.1 hypothetical protein P254_00824 [Acinetobacter oleivorans CIP 110421]MBE2171027.1 hypothetical protein [Acinetobacter oleivorans]